MGRTIPFTGGLQRAHIDKMMRGSRGLQRDTVVRGSPLMWTHALSPVADQYNPAQVKLDLSGSFGQADRIELGASVRALGSGVGLKGMSVFSSRILEALRCVTAEAARTDISEPQILKWHMDLVRQAMDSNRDDSAIIRYSTVIDIMHRAIASYPQRKRPEILGQISQAIKLGIELARKVYIKEKADTIRAKHLIGHAHSIEMAIKKSEVLLYFINGIISVFYEHVKLLQAEQIPVPSIRITRPMLDLMIFKRDILLWRGDQKNACIVNAQAISAILSEVDAYLQGSVKEPATGFDAQGIDILTLCKWGRKLLDTHRDILLKLDDRPGLAVAHDKKIYLYRAELENLLQSKDMQTGDRAYELFAGMVGCYKEAIADHVVPELLLEMYEQILSSSNRLTVANIFSEDYPRIMTGFADITFHAGSILRRKGGASIAAEYFDIAAAVYKDIYELSSSSKVLALSSIVKRHRALSFKYRVLIFLNDTLFSSFAERDIRQIDSEFFGNVGSWIDAVNVLSSVEEYELVAWCLDNAAMHVHDLGDNNVLGLFMKLKGDAHIRDGRKRDAIEAYFEAMSIFNISGNAVLRGEAQSALSQINDPNTSRRNRGAN